MTEEPPFSAIWAEKTGFKCKACQSELSLKSWQELADKATDVVPCQRCFKEELIPVCGREVEDLQPLWKIRIIYKHTHSTDEYYEDDYGHEHHTLRGVTTLEMEDVFCKDGALQLMREKLKEIGESNADNPPYDEYQVLVTYDVLTKEILPAHWTEDDGE